MTEAARTSSARKLSQGGGASKPIDLDDVLVEEIGQFGKFQMTHILLVAVPIIMSAFMSEYIFSAASLSYRCAVPECDAGESPAYQPGWIDSAIPSIRNTDNFDSCTRYAPLQADTPPPPPGTCPANLFDSNVTIDCDGQYVYGDKTNSVVYDFGLECQEFWRTFPGMMNSVGTLLVLPVTGFISDRYGRRFALIVSIFNLALIGFIRAFSVNYPMYVALHLLQTTLGAGTYSSAYVFATELVGPKYRVLTSATCSSMYAVGQIVMGGVAWLVQPWRYMIMTLHIPCFLVVSYYWILSESVRWLLSKKKFEEAREVLQRVARFNNKQISEKSMQALMNPHEEKSSAKERPGLIKTILTSSVLLRRACTTPVWWITTTFVYYGLSINSTSLSGNIYLNFILVSAIEIPGYFTAVLVLNRIGRKPTLSTGFFVSAACNIAFSFTPENEAVVRLVLFMVGKFGIAVVFTSLYLYTSELYPTEYRHSLLAFSSMVGRVGSITAPLTPVLAEYWRGLPTMMFGSMGLLAGVLVLTQPETLGTKMPDTLEEAEKLGQQPMTR